MTARAPILPRALAMLAALCLVGAFALAVFFPPQLTLERLAARVDHTAVLALQEWVRERLGEWTWPALVVPVLARPAWLFPLTLGIVLAGLALTLGWRRRVPDTPHWRN